MTFCLWSKKKKKPKKTRPKTMVKERTAVKIAHKHCRMGLENILERKNRKVLKSYLN